MASPLAHVTAARVIVRIQEELSSPGRMHPATRERLITEQRSVWEAIFPNTPYEVIAGSVH